MLSLGECCKGSCKKFESTFAPHRGITYYVNQENCYCSICEIYLNYKGSHCPCCGTRLRRRPKNSPNWKREVIKRIG